MDHLDFLGARAHPAGGVLMSNVPIQLRSWSRTPLEVIGIGGLLVLLITMTGVVLWALRALLDAGSPY